MAEEPNGHRVSLQELLERSKSGAGIRTGDMFVEEFGGTIKLRGLTFRDHKEAAKASSKVDKDGNPFTDDVEQSRQILIRAIVEPELGPEHASLVDNWSVSTVLMLTNKIMELSGIEPGQVVPAGGMAGPQGFFGRRKPVSSETGSGG